MREILKIIPVGLALVFGTALLCNAAHSKQMPCSVESTGLKYTEIEGSGFASAIFIVPLLALAPLAGATDTTGQYRCHVSVIGRDAIGAKIKKKYRPVVEPQ